MKKDEVITNNNIKLKFQLIIEELLLYLKSNPNRLAKDLGYKSNVKIQHIKSGRNSISVEVANDIVRKFPEINYNWLLTGEGEMLNKADDNENSNDKEGMEVLLLPVSAEGGRLDNFSTQVLAEDCETVISPIKGVDFAMTVTGDSMFPEYPSGSRVLVKKINEKAFIDWGRVYVLDTCNGTVIKKIMPSEYEGKIRCESINPEYPPFEVCFDDIFGMYRVLMCMSLK